MTKPIKPCRICGAEFTPTPSKIRYGDWRCAACKGAKTRLHREQHPELWLAYYARNGKTQREKPGYRERARPREERFRQKHKNDPQRKRKLADKAKLMRKNPITRVRIESRLATRRAIEAGKLMREPCLRCGAVKVEAHHEDYARPLEVKWLCRRCHAAEHIRLRKARAQSELGG